MRAIMMRTGSMPVPQRFVPGSPKVSLSRNNSVGEFFSGNDDKTTCRISLNVGSSDRSPVTRGMRRAFSESDVIRSASRGVSLQKSAAGSKSQPAIIPEEEEEEEFAGGWGSLIWEESGIPVEEIGYSGGGIGRGSGNGGGNGDTNRGGGYGDKSKIGEYYREMLKSNPNNSLLLMNYGKFLYEVENDVERAVECYGRAIVESPGDGEALSMYGKLIWETQRDEDRAKTYFDQAVNASPNDCMVLGSYAHFMWEADEDDEEDEEVGVVSPAMVSAF